jgi:hypothetical protein
MDRRSDSQESDTRHYVAVSSGTGKTHPALGLGLAACQKGYSVSFTPAAALVHELMEARDERRLRATPLKLASSGPKVIHLSLRDR